MDVKVGDIVISKRGHDAGKAFIVVALLNESYALIADGKSRKLASPKQKNVKHLKTVAGTDADKLGVIDDKTVAGLIKQTQTDIEK